MHLPINLGYKPMEAKSATDLPTGNHWQYEPKWDGFRCLAFRDGEKIELQSKAGRSLTRYFPDIVHALKSLKSQLCYEEKLSYTVFLDIHVGRTEVGRKWKYQNMRNE